MNIPLAARLRQATQALHTEVERAGLMRLLLRGELPLAGYAALLRSLHALYEPLERGLARHAAHPQIAPLWQPGLARSAALARDLEHLLGPAWARRCRPAVAADAYAAHLEALDAAEPGLLAAHAYVRYLGDLSGGQMLARVVARSLGTTAEGALAFYDFGGAAQVSQLAAALRSGLDRIATSEAQAQALIDEACAAFGRHRELFVELGEALGAADRSATGEALGEVVDPAGAAG